MKLSKKDIMAIKIAFAIDDYYYDKDTKGYFDKMPVIGLADSQEIFINEYLQAIEEKDTSNEFSRILYSMKRDNERYKKLLKAGSRSKAYKRNVKVSSYIIRTMEKFQKNY